MKGQYTKKIVKKIFKNIKGFFKNFLYEIKRYFVKKSIKNKDFTIISNNCWAGRCYQYLDMPYLTPTVGLYFFADEYLRFVSDLHYYLSIELEFIKPENSKYYNELKIRNQLNRPIGKLGDVEIVFLHYKTETEAKEKWDRRKQRVNFDNILIKFSRMDLCTEEHIKKFDSLNFKNKFILNNRLPLKYKSEIYWNEKYREEGIYRDTTPFPGTLKLSEILNFTPITCININDRV